MRQAARSLVLLAALLAAPLVAAPGASLTLDDVVALLEAHVGDTLILKQVAASGARFDLGVAEILRLKKAGAGDALIETLLDAGEPSAAAPADTPEIEGGAFRIFREVGDDGKPVLHITNLDAAGRRMGPAPDVSEPARPNAVAAPRDEMEREDDGERYVVIGDEGESSPPVVVNVFPPEPGPEYAGASYGSPYMYRDPYAYLYPRGRLPGFYGYRWGCRRNCAVPSPPGSASHFRMYHTHYGGPAHFGYGTPSSGASSLGPHYRPIGPASGAESLARMRAQVRVGHPRR